MLFLAFAILTTYATTTQVGVEEVNLAMNPSTSSMLQIPLIMDSFTKLDLNHDGVLDKTERKPLTYDMYLTTAILYSEGDHVTRELFVENVVVVDFAQLEGTTEQCLHEDAVVSMSAEDLWTEIAGEQAWMTVHDFADALYEVSEPDDDLTYAQFQQFAVSHTYPEDFHADDQFTLVKLSDYTESHNEECQATAVRRRKLFVGEALTAAAYAVGQAVAIAAVGAVAECSVQAVMHHYFPSGYMHQLYDEGCTRNQFTTDFAFNLGAQAFTHVGLWAWGGASSFFGFGAASASTAATAGAAGGAAVEAVEIGAPLLADASTQTVSQVASAGTQTVVDTALGAVEQTAETIGSIFQL